MSDLISIIIPVYNSEKYIGNCLESILKQTYKNIEIIIIDDGSTDDSAKICDAFSRKDNRIKVYHISNSGVAIARNIGLEKSKGKFIAFSDSDDLYEIDFLEKAITLIEEADYFSGAFLTFSQTNKENLIDYLADTGKEEIILVEKYLKKMLDYQAGAYWGANWGKLYYKDIIYKNNIQFESKVQFAEDFRFNLEYLKYVEKVAISHFPVYKYRVDTTESLSKKRRNSKVYWKEYMELFKRYKILFEQKNLFFKYDLKIYEFFIRAGIIVLRDGIYSGDLNIKGAKILAEEIEKDFEKYNVMNYISKLNKAEKKNLKILRKNKIFLIGMVYVKKYLRKLFK